MQKECFNSVLIKSFKRMLMEKERRSLYVLMPYATSSHPGDMAGV